MGVKVRQQRGAWWLFVSHEKRRVAKRVGVGRLGKKAADLAAVQIAAKLAQGDTTIFDPPPAQAATATFAEVAETWLTTYPRASRHPPEHDGELQVLYDAASRPTLRYDADHRDHPGDDRSFHRQETCARRRAAPCLR